VGRNQRRLAVQIAAFSPIIHLPFLWPASLRQSATLSDIPIKNNTLSKTRSQTAKSGPSRGLASVAGHVNSINSSPFSQELQSESTFHWDYPSYAPPAKPLVLEQAYEKPRSRRSALGNTSLDFLQNLYACVRVGRFDRAEGIIQRLQDMSDATDSEIMHAHEVYLEARLHSLSQTNIQKDYDAMKRWFRTQNLQSRNNPGQACLIMIEAALALPVSKRSADDIKELTSMSHMKCDEILDEPHWTDEGYQRLEHIFYPDRIADPVPARIVETSQVLPESIPFKQTDIPDILQVDQRGSSMSFLKRVLEIKNEADASADAKDMSNEELRNVVRERLVEDAAADAAIEKWRNEDSHLQSMGINGALSNKSTNAMMWSWYSALVTILREELSDIKSRLNKKSITTKRGDGPRPDIDLYGIFIEAIKPETLAVNTVIFLMNTISQEKDQRSGEYLNHVRVADAAKNLATQIEEESMAEVLRKNDGKPRIKAQKRAITKSNIKRRSKNTTLIDHVEWPLAIKVKIGAMLISKFLEVAKMPISREHPRTKVMVTRLRPAFHHKVVYVGGRKQALLMPCPELREKVRHEPAGSIICKRLPMLVKPQKWTGFRQGGYLNYVTDFVRIPAGDPTPRDYALAAISKGDMQQVFDAINVLSKIPWRMNDDILRVQIEAWNTGSAIGNFAPLHPDLEYPKEPEPSSDPQVRAKWLLNIQEIENTKSGFHSQRCHQNLQLEIAKAFRHDTIYFPHNVDFRGRAYPVPPYLNHMGADNVRALMVFAEGKKLGTTGLRWLKIHLSNVYGYDKASFTEREEFVDNNMDKILDSAENPLTGRKWWLKSEDAWQTLAACFELCNALKLEDPTEFVSHLPIQQDGTCNGLQHYAALGGDEAGARQVNLEPGDRPSDVYSAVAEGVIAAVEQDFKAGSPIAKILHGRITRKVVKQPVMTNVYGVTYFGARQQVKRQLEDMFPEITSGDLINHRTLAAYIARKIFNSFGHMFTGAQAIQDWLSVCADRIATSITPEQVEALKQTVAKNAKSNSKKVKVGAQFKSTVIWTTPLRFPVVQPYRDVAAKAVQTQLSNVLIWEPQRWDPVSRRKQLQGFPPNFIHSLDATHMMLCAIKCEERGMTFASIHDSFWTHACDRDELSEVLRDAFVHMHREDIIGRLKEEFEARYKGCIYFGTLFSTDTAAQKIIAWRKSKEAIKAFEHMRSDVPQMEREMILESQRIQLLNSKDVKEQQKGREMVTPASIFLEHGNEKSVIPTLGTASTGLGNAPEFDPLIVAEANESSTSLLQHDDTYNDFVDTPSKSSEDSNLNEAEIRMRLLGQDPHATKSSSSTAINKRNKISVWLPLEFPDVPRKGTFDVTRLKQSRYFFH